jgi:hypothetical protein
MGVDGGRRLRLATLWSSESRLARKYGNLDLSQPYGPLLPVTRIALTFYLRLPVRGMMYPQRCFRRTIPWQAYTWRVRLAFR